ncbi:MAG: DNA-binding transcriptional regulator [Opitutaceae bacterium]|nr:DNA-binding transcriptional regulator [Opitutaceae bacterium]
MRPNVLLVFNTRLEECVLMLRGIGKYERTHRAWHAFIDDEARAENDDQWLRSQKWDGVISRHTSPKLASVCKALGIPLVDMHDCEPFPGVPKLRPDNTAIGHLGAEHFLERGFFHLGFSGFGNCDWSRKRRDGFVESAKLAGHTVSIHDVDYPGNLTPFWDEGQLQVISKWMQSLPKPVGIMACNDLRALQVIGAAHSCNYMVPEEVAVLGANNEAIRCELSYPPLSSIEGNSLHAGYLAAEALSCLMDGIQPSAMESQIEPLGVVTRHSTDVLAITNRSVAAALSFIRENAAKGISVDDVLKRASMSRSQLEKKFRQFIGRSPQAEIRRVQVARIQRLLIETDYPLKKIAELAGFEHVEYLSVVFKRITGQSPGSYRRKMQTQDL